MELGMKRKRRRKSKPISEEEHASIIERYKKGEKVSDIAKDYKTSTSTVYMVLYKGQVPLRSRGRRSKLTVEQKKAYLQRLINGEPLMDIANELGLTYANVWSALRLTNSPFMAPRKFPHKIPPEDIPKIVAEYNSSPVSLSQLGEKYKVSRQGIHQLLVRNGVELREKDARLKIRPDSEEEVVNKYKELGTVKATAEFFEVCATTVKRVLVKNGVEVKNPRHKLDPKKRNEIIKKYKEGRTAAELAEEYGISISSIWPMLRKAGIKARKLKKVPFSLYPEIYKKRKKGQKIAVLATEYGVTSATMSRILKRIESGEEEWKIR
jgi:Mor family transcriptional regulator/predicted DNA-binding protein YlxM (UPF0122 family)